MIRLNINLKIGWRVSADLFGLGLYISLTDMYIWKSVSMVTTQTRLSAGYIIMRKLRLLSHGLPYCHLYDKYITNKWDVKNIHADFSEMLLNLMLHIWRCCHSVLSQIKWRPSYFFNFENAVKKTWELLTLFFFLQLYWGSLTIIPSLQNTASLQMFSHI